MRDDAAAILAALDWPAPVIACAVTGCTEHPTHRATCTVCDAPSAEWCVEHRYDAGTDTRLGTCPSCHSRAPLYALLIFHPIEKD